MTIPLVLTTNAGTYSVTVSNIAGLTNSIAASLTVNVPSYTVLYGSLTNYIFQGDTTYYIPGTVNLYGTNTFEGGAVLKYAANAQINVVSNLVWLATAYRPVIFTAKDDNSAGASINGSTGNPTNYYGNAVLSFTNAGTLTLSNLRIAYARQALSMQATYLNVYDAQVVNCQNGFSGNWGNIANFRNVLFSNVRTNFNNIDYMGIIVQNGTFNGSTYLLTTRDGRMNLFLTNCILANITNLTSYPYSGLPTGGYNGFYNCTNFGTNTRTNTFYPFQTVGAGNYYLAGGGAFTNAGTTNIDALLLADLQRKTTCSPNLLAGPITNATVLSAVIQRDTDTPDLGYHYAPIDYLVSNVNVSATLTLTNGVALGLMGSSGSLTLQNYGSLVSQGTALALNYLAHYANVQEQPVNPGSGVVGQSGNSTNMNVALRYTDISMPGGGYTYVFYGVHSYGPGLSFRDCQLHGCYFFNAVMFGTQNISITNNLFDRCNWTLAADNGWSAGFYNNLFRGGTVFTLNAAASAAPWSVQDNLFDRAVMNATSTNNLTCSYNAFTARHHQLSGRDKQQNQSGGGLSGRPIGQLLLSDQRFEPGNPDQRREHQRQPAWSWQLYRYHQSSVGRHQYREYWLPLCGAGSVRQPAGRRGEMEFPIKTIQEHML